MHATYTVGSRAARAFNGTLRAPTPSWPPLDGTTSVTENKTSRLRVRLDGNETREVIQQAADGIDRNERSWFPNLIHAGHAGSIMFTGNQLRRDLHRWLAPPDPSTNHNIACNVHHKGTATWFFEGSTYKDGKSTGSEPLLWIHGNWETYVPVPFRCPTPSNKDPYL